MKTPKPPDPVATANAQASMNRETAITQAQLAMMNQSTPFGNLSYKHTGYWEPEAQSAWMARGKEPEAATSGPEGPMRRGGWWSSNRANGMQGRSGMGGAGGYGVHRPPGGGQFDFSKYTPRYEAIQTLSPEMQQIMDQTMAGAGNLASQINQSTQTPMDFSRLPRQVTGIDTAGLPGVTTGVNAGNIQRALNTTGLASLPGQNDFGAERQRVEEALFSRLNPQIDRDRAALETKLINQGVMPGTEAYREAMGGLDRSIADQRSQVVLAGGQEQSRLFADALAARGQGFGERTTMGQFANTAQQQAFDQGMQNAGLRNTARQQLFGERQTNAAMQNQARQQGINEIVMRRQQPLNEMAALLSSSQIQSPNFVNTPQVPVAGVDYAGLVNQNYQAQLAQSQSMMGGIGGLAGGIFGLFSDKRLKTDEKRIGKTDGGTPIYSYRYKGDPTPQVGVMAQDLEKKQPEAVGSLFGLKTVRYDLVK